MRYIIALGVQIYVSDISSSEEELNNDDDVLVIQFQDAVEVPIDNLGALMEDASMFNNDLNAMSNNKEIIIRFEQFLIFVKLKFKVKGSIRMMFKKNKII